MKEKPSLNLHEPVANTDIVNLYVGDKNILISPLVNDTDEDGDRLSLDWAESGHGDIVYNQDGTFSYTPDDGYVGEHIIYYKVSDDGGKSATGEILVTVREME